MPRLARLDAPGALHHIMIRGIERRNIFKDNKDRDNLIGRLALLLPETQTSCYAWVLMPNHAHFLFRTGTVSLSTVMRRLLTGYAVTFNHRHKRHGQLFQNRYKSIICQEDIYLRELVRYIHLNPLRAKNVRDISELSRYSYCGHSALMGKKERPWQDTDYVLSCFGKRVGEARGHQSRRVDARSLVCYWAVRELGIALTELARNFAMSPSAISYAVERGEVIATDNNYQLVDY